MSKYEKQVTGTFSSPEETKNALVALEKAGFQDVTLFSPLDPGELDLPVRKGKSRIGWFTWSGAFLGMVFGGAFSVGTALVYPINVGGFPVLSLPAIGIIAFDFLLLGAMVGTVVGFLYCALWASRPKGDLPGDITGHAFALRVWGNETMLKLATEVLKKTGARKIGGFSALFGAGLSFVLLIPALVLGFPGSGNMMNQPTLKSQERAVKMPSSLIPHSAHSWREPFSQDEAALLENPTPLSEKSFARGKKLYETFCTLCHGKKGKGDGLMAERIGEFPDFSKPEFLDQPDGCLYYVITNGANFEEEVFRPREAATDDAHSDEGGEIIWDDEPAGEIIWDDPSHDDTDGHHAHDKDMASSEVHIHEDGEKHNHASDEDHHKDEFSGGGPATTDHAHEHDTPQMAMVNGDGHDHAHDNGHAHSEDMGHDDGHAHDHGGSDGHDDHAHDAPTCGGGHSHGSGGHGHGDDDGHGHAHGSGKKHFMPPHRDAILPVDRWHIVNYIRYELLN